MISSNDTNNSFKRTVAMLVDTDIRGVLPFGATVNVFEVHGTFKVEIHVNISKGKVGYLWEST